MDYFSYQGDVNFDNGYTRYNLIKVTSDLFEIEDRQIKVGDLTICFEKRYITMTQFNNFLDYLPKMIEDKYISSSSFKTGYWIC